MSDDLKSSVRTRTSINEQNSIAASVVVKKFAFATITRVNSKVPSIKNKTASIAVSNLRNLNAPQLYSVIDSRGKYGLEIANHLKKSVPKLLAKKLVRSIPIEETLK
jgi:hypothetical protein